MDSGHHAADLLAETDASTNRPADSTESVSTLQTTNVKRFVRKGRTRTLDDTKSKTSEAAARGCDSEEEGWISINTSTHFKAHENAILVPDKPIAEGQVDGGPQTLTLPRPTPTSAQNAAAFAADSQLMPASTQTKTPLIPDGKQAEGLSEHLDSSGGLQRTDFENGQQHTVPGFGGNNTADAFFASPLLSTQKARNVKSFSRKRRAQEEGQEGKPTEIRKVSTTGWLVTTTTVPVGDDCECPYCEPTDL
jgi:hypothetical protein